MYRVIGYGHTLRRIMDFFEDTSMSHETLDTFSNYLALLRDEEVFRKFMVKMFAMVQEHYQIEEDQDSSDFYEQKEGEFNAELASLQRVFPNADDLWFCYLYDFAAGFLEYLDEEVDIDEIWDLHICDIDINNDRIIVYFL